MGTIIIPIVVAPWGPGDWMGEGGDHHHPHHGGTLGS